MYLDAPVYIYGASRSKRRISQGCKRETPGWARGVGGFLPAQHVRDGEQALRAGEILDIEFHMDSHTKCVEEGDTLLAFTPCNAVATLKYF
jgi:hypothetical protein